MAKPPFREPRPLGLGKAHCTWPSGAQPPPWIPDGTLATVDISGDRCPDRVGTNKAGVTVSLGIGNGSFGAAKTFAAGNNPVALAVADLDGDGTPDVTVANKTYGGTASVLLNVSPAA